MFTNLVVGVGLGGLSLCTYLDDGRSLENEEGILPVEVGEDALVRRVEQYMDRWVSFVLGGWYLGFH